MTEPVVQTRRIAIMQELLALTNQMIANRADVDILVDCVEKRQSLIDQYDQISGQEGYDNPLSPTEAVEVKRIARLILERDESINQLLISHRDDAKNNMVDNTRQQKVLGYMNNAISGTGSYMDYKK